MINTEKGSTKKRGGPIASILPIHLRKFANQRGLPLFYLPGCILLLSLLPLVSCGMPPGNAADGKRWYLMNNCNACHGLHGNDGRAPDIAGLEMGFASFVRKLRTTDAPIMPPFPASKVSKQDAADIYMYLKSIKAE